MIARRSRRGGARAIALIAAVGLVGAAFAGTAGTAGAQSSKLLGTKNVAKGTPVKIGVISNGKTPTVDQSEETPVAEAAAEWINQYQGGLNGHPIDLTICDDHGTASEATDCANKMIADKVAAVVVGQESQLEAIWNALHTSGIPVYYYGASNPNVVADPNTFVFTNGHAVLLGLPAGVAKKNKSKKVSVVAIDVPAATSFFKDPGPALYKEEGLELELIPIAAGTADMTPQMQKLASGNPNGTVFIIGNDAFCIAALNGLRTAAFKGKITTIPQCLTDATRTAVPADFLEGISISATSPIQNPKDPSMKQYYAVLDKFGASSVDKSNIGGAAMFMAVAGFAAANKGLKGDPTSAALSEATKKMDWTVLPGSGGLHFRCNSKADSTQPAVCSNGTLVAQLNPEGNVTKYVPVGDDQIPA
jgi:ABC-type branched-subunit amino acid transport system substrate-binding protein